jgi:hypothetical protein
MYFDDVSGKAIISGEDYQFDNLKNPLIFFNEIQNVLEETKDVMNNLSTPYGNTETIEIMNNSQLNDKSLYR